VRARVRGMGVAVMINTWGLGALRWRMARCRTPKRCCSSTMTSPSFLKRISSSNRAWVPMAREIRPSSRSWICRRRWAAVRWRLKRAHWRGSPSRNFFSVRKCCSANISVGAMRTACWPFSTASSMADRATTVFPDPTSP